MIYNFPFEKSDFITKNKEITPGSSMYYWFISANKIFSSNIPELKEFSRFYSMEFGIKRASIFNEGKSSDSYICGEEVKIYMPSGRHCAVLQSRLADKSPISKIAIKKAGYAGGELVFLEDKEFKNCSVQSFEVKGDVVAFTFRYTGYSDTYTDYKEDGTKLGTSATDVDLITWKVKEK